MRAMPCPPIGIHAGIGRLGQRAMRHAAVGLGCRPVDRRAHQRMAESHASTELDQAGGLGRGDRVGSDAESLSRAPEQRHVADRLGRRREQQLLCLERQRLHSLAQPA